LPWTSIETKDLVKLAEIWDKPFKTSCKHSSNSIYAWAGVELPADSGIFSQVEGLLRVFEKSYTLEPSKEGSVGESIAESVVEGLFNSLFAGL
jgi:hypothetical protein